MQTITVCTDAGHKNSHKQSVAVWAAYIRTPSQTIHASGIIRRTCKGSSHAELYAIANALAIIGKQHDLSRYKLIVYSDNLYALQNHLDGTLGKKKTNKNNEHKQVYDKWIRPYVIKAHQFEARHVKAHLPKAKWGGAPRFYMQNWCDKEVHRIMKIATKMVLNRVKNKLVLSSKKAHNEIQSTPPKEG